MGKVLYSHLHISITRAGTSQNSSDLSLGRRPESKSVDFCEVPPLVIEIISILVEIARRLCVHLLGFGVHDPSRSPCGGQGGQRGQELVVLPVVVEKEVLS